LSEKKGVINMAEQFSMLEQVKTALGITGSFQDNLLELYIDEVQQFLFDGGVSQDVVESEKCVGVVVRGVADLWNYGSGGTSLSPYFIQRASQLALKYGVTNEATIVNDGSVELEITHDGEGNVKVGLEERKHGELSAES
jgi:hypothetical protein